MEPPRNPRPSLDTAYRPEHPNSGWTRGSAKYEQVLQEDSIGKQPQVRANAVESSSKRGGNLSRNLWVFEIFCATCTILSFVATAAILRHFDGKPLSEWKFNISTGRSTTEVSLNFIVSLLSTISRASFAALLSSGISQTKWIWFAQERRPLYDFQTFDDASRGPLGSVMLLWKTKAIRLASLGAFLTVLGLSFDPFVQLTVAYPGGAVTISDDTATLAYSQGYNRGRIAPTSSRNSQQGYTAAAGEFGASTALTDPDLIAAIYTGLWVTSERQTPTFSCASGNCTWPLYTSLAVCNKCFSMNDLVEVSESNSTFEPGVGYVHEPPPKVGAKVDKKTWLSITLYEDVGYIREQTMPEIMRMTTTSDPAETLSFRDSQTLIWAVKLLRVDDTYLQNKTKWEESRFVAAECGLHLCSNTYNTTIQIGQYMETIISSHSQKVPSSYRPYFGVDSDSINESLIFGNDSWRPIQADRDYSNTSRYDYQLQLSEEQAQMAGVLHFNVSQGALKGMMQYFRFLFGVQPISYQPNEGGSAWRNSKSTEFSEPMVQPFYDSRNNLTALMDSLATDLSAAIRSAGAATSDRSPQVIDAPPGSIAASPELAIIPPLRGFRQDYIIKIEVEWPFLVVPGLLCFFSVIFIVAAIWQTHRRSLPVYKEGALAGLVWGLEPVSRVTARSDWRARGPEAMKGLRVNFKGGKGGGELILQEGWDTSMGQDTDSTYYGSQNSLYGAVKQ